MRQHSWDLLQLFSALLISVSTAVGMSLEDSVPIIMEPICKVTCFLLQHGSSRFAEINDCSPVGLRKKAEESHSGATSHRFFYCSLLFA